MLISAWLLTYTSVYSLKHLIILDCFPTLSLKISSYFARRLIEWLEAKDLGVFLFDLLTHTQMR